MNKNIFKTKATFMAILIIMAMTVPIIVGGEADSQSVTENPTVGEAGLQSVSDQENPVSVGVAGSQSVTSDQLVSYNHASVLNVRETITQLPGGQWRYSYDFTNTDTSGIWHFGVWLPFTIVSGSSTLFTQKPGWSTDDGVPIGSVLPAYDARNLDPTIVLNKNIWGPGWKLTTDPISVGQFVSGYSFVANVYDPSPKYYYYEFVNSYAAETGIITAVGRTTGISSGNMVFTRGSDNGLWYRTFNGVWGPWTGLGGIIKDDPDATVLSGKVYVFARGTNDALWFRVYDGSWGPWTSLGGIINSSPGVSTWGNKLYVFARGTNNALWCRSFDGTSWTDWASLGGVINSGPGAS